MADESGKLRHERKFSRKIPNRVKHVFTMWPSLIMRDRSFTRMIMRIKGWRKKIKRQQDSSSRLFPKNFINSDPWFKRKKLWPTSNREPFVCAYLHTPWPTHVPIVLLFLKYLRDWIIYSLDIHTYKYTWR